MYQRNNKIRIATQHFAFVWQMVTVLWGRTSTQKKEKCTTKYARETYRIIESSNSSFNFFLGREGDEAVSLGFWCPRNVGNRGAEDLALFREEVFKNFCCHSLRKVTNINLVLTIYKYRLRFWCWSINVWQETLCDIHFNFSTTNLLVEDAKIWVIPWLHYPQSLQTALEQNFEWRTETSDAYSPVESLNCSIGLFSSAHGDKSKAPAPICVLVVHNLHETIGRFN